jgi:hypothetical protein
MSFHSVRRVALLLIAGLVSSSAVLSQPQQDTVSSANIELLLKSCKSTYVEPRSLCFGIVIGSALVMKLVGLTASGAERQRFGMCWKGPEPSNDAEIQAFINWANANPQMWGQDGSAGVVITLTTTWPCS